MIAQSRPIQNYINVITGNFSPEPLTIYDVPYHATAANGCYIAVPTIETSRYWQPPETLAELGRMILKRKQRANYQLIYRRRNRNLHIQ